MFRGAAGGKYRNIRELIETLRVVMSDDTLPGDHLTIAGSFQWAGAKVGQDLGGSV